MARVREPDTSIIPAKIATRVAKVVAEDINCPVAITSAGVALCDEFTTQVMTCVGIAGVNDETCHVLNINVGADSHDIALHPQSRNLPSCPRALVPGVVAAFLVGFIEPACAFVVNTSIRVPSLASTTLGGKAVLSVALVLAGSFIVPVVFVSTRCLYHQLLVIM